MRTRHIILTLLFAMLHFCGAWAEGETRTFTFLVNPEGVATPSESVVTIEDDGSSYHRVSCYLRNINPLYVFKDWTNSAGEVVSTNEWLTEYFYEFPTQDEVFTANFVKNPLYEPDPSRHSFRFCVTPDYMGDFGIDSQRYYEPGAEIQFPSFETRGVPSSYHFAGWFNEAGDCVTDNFYGKCTAPDHDDTFTARFEFDPDSPDLPTPVVVNTTLTVEVEPQGLFDTYQIVSDGPLTRFDNIRYDTYTTNAIIGRPVRVIKGRNITLSLSKKDYQLLYWEDADGNRVSVNEYNQVRFTMPDQDVRLRAVFRYNPESPTLPNTNPYNPEDGLLIMDEYKPGKLWSAINQMIWDNPSIDARAIIVNGIVTNDDMYLTEDFNAAHQTRLYSLDFSRVTGAKTLGRIYSNTLEVLKLPACIDSISGRAFDFEEDNNRFRELTIFAKTPPKLFIENSSWNDWSSLSRLPKTTVIYVPATSVNLYRQAEGWGEYAIQPIIDDIVNLTVSFPAGTDMSRYRNMKLQLRNAKSGEGYSYIVGDARQYTFTEVIKHAQYEVLLLNAQGQEFGRTATVDVDESDVTAAFTTLLQPVSPRITVKAAGADVTSDVMIDWYDTTGAHIAQAAGLDNQAAGTTVTARISLGESLSVGYQQPAEQQWTLTASNALRTVDLTPLAVMPVTGTVVSHSALASATSASGKDTPLAGVVVTATQQFGTATTSVSTTTDARGQFTLNLRHADAIVTYSASNHEARTDTLKAASNISLSDVVLEEMHGTQIGLSLYARAAARSNESSDLTEINTADALTFTVKDAQSGKVFTDFQAMGKTITLREALPDFTELVITAESAKGAKAQETLYTLSTTYTTVSNNSATASLTLTERGAIGAHFGRANNRVVRAMLYDEQGKFVTTTTYDAHAEMLLGALPDGYYTLVTMGECRMLNDFATLDQYEAVGLRPEVDYAINSVQVSAGVISDVEVPVVPLIYEEKFYYTDSNTAFTLNRSKATVGNYVTASCKVDFKEQYASKVSNLAAIFELPEGVDFVPGSLVLGNTTYPYTIDDHKVTVEMGDATAFERLRFCFIPTDEGKCSPMAYVRFTMNGREMTQPIGKATCDVQLLGIIVNETQITPTFTAAGQAPVGSIVKLMVDDAEMTRTTVKSDGEWRCEAEFIDPYNLQTFNVRADITTPNGLNISTRTVEVTYDKYFIEAVSVDMKFLNTWLAKANGMPLDHPEEVVFNLRDKTVSKKSYYFYQETDFTFTIDLSNNDPSLIDGLQFFVYTSQQKWEEVEAIYNEAIGRWVAVKSYNASCLPAGVDVRVLSKGGRILGSRCVNDAYANIFDIANQEKMEEYEALRAQFEDILKNGTDEEFEAYNRRIAELLGYEFEDIDIDGDVFFTIDDLKRISAELDALVGDKPLDFSALIGATPEQIAAMGTKFEGFEMLPAEGLTHDILIEQGYEFLQMTEGAIYTLVTDSKYHVVDLANGIHFAFDIPKDVRRLMARARAAAESEEGFDWAGFAAEVKDKLSSWGDDIRSGGMQLAQACTDVMDGLSDAITLLEGKVLDMRKMINYGKKANWSWLEIVYEEGRLALGEKSLAVHKKAFDWLKSNVSPRLKIGDFTGQCFAGIDILFSLYSAHKDFEKEAKVYGMVPDPCPYLPSSARAARMRVGAICVGSIVWYGANISANVASLCGVSGGVLTLLPSGGSSLVIVAAAVGAAAATFAAGKLYSSKLDELLKHEVFRINQIVCDENQRCPKCGRRECVCEPDFPGSDGQMDPSGYVYEGIEDNRVEGATATCYVKRIAEDMYGDLYEDVSVWDGAAYGEINPQLTDKMGVYHWDVPQGLYQVRLDKEGYETTTSEWLPVPPPQLEVNLPMRQTTPPTVVSAHAYPTGIEMEFSKHMATESMTDLTVLVSQNGNSIEGTLQYVDEAVDPSGATTEEGVRKTLARRVRFVPTVSFGTKGKVQLFVSRRVKSYAGISMEQDFQQTFDIEPEITSIDVPETFRLHEGSTEELTIEVLPVEASAGRIVTITGDNNIARFSDTSVVLNPQGRATVSVTGIVPGTVPYVFHVQGYEREARSIVSVTTFNPEPPLPPFASIASGSLVDVGTGIYLSCETPNTTIYYTLDGSCPCENTPARYRYDGSPIIVTGKTNIRAIAISRDGVESETVSFFYVTDPADLEGVKAPIVTTTFTIAPSRITDRIKVTLPAGTPDAPILLVGMDGKALMEVKTTDGTATLNVAHLPAGTYIVVAKTQRHPAAKKVQKF